MATEVVFARDQEISSIRNQLWECKGRLLTLTGPPGSGKTWLAQSVNRTSYRVDLGSVSEPWLVPHLVTAALRREWHPNELPLDVMPKSLGDETTVLLLDHCDDLRDDCAAVVEKIRNANLNLRILATSERPLGAPRETTWEVSGVNDERPEVSPDLRRVLDGRPLALRLASTTQASADQLAAELDKARGESHDGARPQPAAAVELLLHLAWQRLPESDRAVMRRLTVLADVWSLPSAEAVCAFDGLTPDEVIDAIVRLQQAGLVDWAEPWLGATLLKSERFRIPESIRRHVRAELAANQTELEAARLRHREYFTSIVESDPVIRDRLNGNEAAAAILERRAPELLPNLRVAYSALADGDPVIRAQVATRIAKACLADGRLVEARHRVGDAVAAERGSASQAEEAIALLEKVEVAWNRQLPRLWSGLGPLRSVERTYCETYEAQLHLRVADFVRSANLGNDARAIAPAVVQSQAVTLAYEAWTAVLNAVAVVLIIVGAAVGFVVACVAGLLTQTRLSTSLEAPTWLGFGVILGSVLVIGTLVLLLTVANQNWQWKELIVDVLAIAAVGVVAASLPLDSNAELWRMAAAALGAAGIIAFVGANVVTHRWRTARFLVVFAFAPVTAVLSSSLLSSPNTLPAWPLAIIAGCVLQAGWILAAAFCRSMRAKLLGLAAVFCVPLLISLLHLLRLPPVDATLIAWFIVVLVANAIYFIATTYMYLTINGQEEPPARSVALLFGVSIVLAVELMNTQASWYAPVVESGLLGGLLGVALLSGFTLAIFIAWALIRAAFLRTKARRYPAEDVLASLCKLLAQVEHPEEEWGSVRFKTNLVRDIEVLARKLEGELADSMPCYDGPTRFWLQTQTRGMSADVRKLKQDVLLPKATGQRALRKALAKKTIVAARGRWGEFGYADAPPSVPFRVRARQSIVGLAWAFVPLAFLVGLVATPLSNLVDPAVKGPMITTLIVFELVGLTNMLNPKATQSFTDTKNLLESVGATLKPTMKAGS